MSEGPLAIGVTLAMVGAFLLIASPTFSPMLNQNIGLWGIFFLTIGVVIIGIRLWVMAQQA